MNNQLEQALRLQLIHIDAWLDGGQRADIAPTVLRAVQRIAADALAANPSPTQDNGNG